MYDVSHRVAPTPAFCHVYKAALRATTAMTDSFQVPQFTLHDYSSFWLAGGLCATLSPASIINILVLIFLVSLMAL